LFFSLLLHLLLATTGAAGQSASRPPAIGERAPDFTLSTARGKRVQLSELNARAPVVLVVLRGYPGYQCPLCNLQAKDFLSHARSFAEAGARVILVYPGPPDGLGARATEFAADKQFPDNFDLVLDPGYELTDRYGLRWDAPGETAYPSTFLIDQQGIVFFARISRSHAGRTRAAEILEVLTKRRAG
jgi:peroxiredoxin